MVLLCFCFGVLLFFNTGANVSCVREGTNKGVVTLEGCYYRLEEKMLLLADTGCFSILTI